MGYHVNYRRMVKEPLQAALFVLISSPLKQLRL
jgi:hypothetical protein